LNNFPASKDPAPKGQALAPEGMVYCFPNLSFNNKNSEKIFSRKGAGAAKKSFNFLFST